MCDDEIVMSDLVNKSDSEDDELYIKSPVGEDDESECMSENLNDSDDSEEWEDEESIDKRRADMKEWLEQQVQESQLTETYVTSFFTEDYRDAEHVRAFNLNCRYWCVKALAKYQNVGVMWMLIRELLVDKSLRQMVAGGMLCDDTGLGKSFQIVKLIMSSFRVGYRLGHADVSRLRTLIIAPKALLTQWETEIDKFKGPLVKGNAWDSRFVKKIESFRGVNMIEKYVGIVIVSYSAFKIPLQDCRGKKARPGDQYGDVPKVLKFETINDEHGNCREVERQWHRIVLDEAHEIRNKKTRVHEEICKLKATCKWAVTATPVQNGIDDLRAISAFVGINANLDIEYIRKNYVLRRVADVEKRIAEQHISSGEQADGFLLNQLPTVKCRVKRLQFSNNADGSSVEQMMYHQVESIMRESLTQKENSRNNIIRNIMFLRQICVDKRIFVKAEIRRQKRILNEEDDDCEEDDVECDQEEELLLENDKERILQKYNILDQDQFFSTLSTKVAYLVRKLSSLNERNLLLPPELREKAVVFCEWHSEMHYILEALTAENIRPECYDGTMSLQERSAVLRRFEMVHPTSTNVLLIQIRSGSEGLNLQMANHLYIMSPTWNPCKEMQAIGRVVRLSHKCNRSVKITRLVISGSIEEQCLKVQEQKKALIYQAMKDNSLSVRLGNALSRADIEKLFLSTDIVTNGNHPSRRKYQRTERKWSAVMQQSSKCLDAPDSEGAVADEIMKVEYIKQGEEIEESDEMSD